MASGLLQTKPTALWPLGRRGKAMADMDRSKIGFYEVARTAEGKGENKKRI